MRREEPSTKPGCTGPESGNPDCGLSGPGEGSPSSAPDRLICPVETAGAFAGPEPQKQESPGPLLIAVVPLKEPDCCLIPVESIRLTIAFHTPMARA